MGTTFIVMMALKLGALGGAGIGLCSAFSFFHNYELNLNKKKKEKGDNDGTNKVGQVLRQKAGSID